LPSPPPRIGSVHAMGLSDVLRLELQPCQLAGFADELGELRGSLGETYETARGARGIISTGRQMRYRVYWRLRLAAKARAPWTTRCTVLR
jgi:hypothetical protein